MSAERQTPRPDLAVAGDQSEDGAPGLRLARARFADDAEAFAPEREAHPAHRVDDPLRSPVPDPQVFDRQ